LNCELFDRYSLSAAFSFKTETLIPYIRELRLQTFQMAGTFIDIDSMESYVQAQDLLTPVLEALLELCPMQLGAGSSELSCRINATLSICNAPYPTHC
jgi:hypothetical protein